MESKTYYDLRKNYDELKNILENEPDDVIIDIYKSALEQLKENYEFIGEMIALHDITSIST